MKRLAFLAYGVFAYAAFLVTALYAIGFIGDFGVPTRLDGAAVGSFWVALAVDVALLALFALQHSVMARPAFKRWWTRIVPEPIERSTYVLASSVALLLMFALWQPMGVDIWRVEDIAGRVSLYALYAFGWMLVFSTTFMINHFDLFGLRQVWLHFRGKPYTHLRFVTPGPYRLVRHPLYVGWLFAFWATPTMTLAHLVFAIATTVYILIAIQLEERDLLAAHGEDYRLYRDRTPMLVPRLLPKESERASA